MTILVSLRRYLKTRPTLVRRTDIHCKRCKTGCVCVVTVSMPGVTRIFGSTRSRTVAFWNATVAQARPTQETTYFGHDLWPRSHRLWPWSVFGIFEGEEGGGEDGEGRVKRSGGEDVEARRVGARRVGAKPRKRVGARRVGGPKFRFFFPSPASILVLFCSLWLVSFFSL